MRQEAREEIMVKTNAVLDRPRVGIDDVIIRQVALKCMEICETLQFSPEGPSSLAKYQRTLCAHAIQKHFGI